ncbi:redox-sensitive transcriptional activator SoxR [Enemella evansiae]|uniref:Redox-sensitive transcriptional activator SoxR n=1 Tax=Enemella evansiae TaxID=2016499 RepID=A0A255GPK6_9ACTN|nr:redox-sensitive transcriptional activator SoxR [Enemella evansiae]OYO06106.1 redox-sensitive transcriptional activator SoxR [Enemella evansiae]OYO17760.1 redox-sensitive transcriptional activator SoxR [Enemella evansiae]
MSELTMSQVTRRSGVSASALRFYEERGLIKAHRTPGNRRVYPRHVLRRLAVIRAAQAVGMSLTEIAASLEPIPHDRPVSRAEWQRLSEAWHDSLELRIEALIELRDGLTGCIGCGCLSQPNCPMNNRNDELGAQGPGPRSLSAVIRLAERDAATADPVSRSGPRANPRGTPTPAPRRPRG